MPHSNLHPQTGADPVAGAVGIGWRHAHYGEVLEQLPAVDFLEVHSENFFGHGGAALEVLARARAHYDISLHGVGLSLGAAAGLDAWHLEQLACLVERIEPVRVSDHASFARARSGQGILHGADLLPVPFSGQALDVLSANVQQVQDRLRRPLLVENLSSYLSLLPGPADPTYTEPGFLAELARRTGCALLVDVNNLYVNALNAELRGEDRDFPGDPLASCLHWLDQLPRDCVGEVHLAGHCLVDDKGLRMAIDDHGSKVAEPVWHLYEHAVRCFGAVPAAVEWDTDVPALDVLLKEATRARLAALASAREAA
jgi:uncharacterized protein (UPF0276 family)